MAQSVLGIDIAKNTFYAALFDSQGKAQTKLFANSPEGFDSLRTWLTEQEAEAVPVCLEATGAYGYPVAVFLHAAGHKVSIINPAAIAAFAKSHLSRTKTDKADALLIARFYLLYQPPAWTPLHPDLCALQEMVRRVDALERMHRMEANRLEKGTFTAWVQTSIEEHLIYLQTQIQQAKEAIALHLKNSVTLQPQRELLTSIPGIADTAAAQVLAELTDIHRFSSARQVAAYAGLAPRIRQSGTSVRGHASLSKLGSSRLRKALYFPAIVALRFNPAVQEFGQRLREKGKSKMLIIGAAMRKLLHIIYGVLKSGKKFDAALSRAA